MSQHQLETMFCGCARQKRRGHEPFHSVNGLFVPGGVVEKLKTVLQIVPCVNRICAACSTTQQSFNNIGFEKRFHNHTTLGIFDRGAALQGWLICSISISVVAIVRHQACRLRLQ